MVYYKIAESEKGRVLFVGSTETDNNVAEIWIETNQDFFLHERAAYRQLILRSKTDYFNNFSSVLECGPVYTYRTKAYNRHEE